MSTIFPSPPPDPARTTSKLDLSQRSHSFLLLLFPLFLSFSFLFSFSFITTFCRKRNISPRDDFPRCDIPHPLPKWSQSFSFVDFLDQFLIFASTIVRDGVRNEISMRFTMQSQSLPFLSVRISGLRIFFSPLCASRKHFPPQRDLNVFTRFVQITDNLRFIDARKKFLSHTRFVNTEILNKFSFPRQIIPE